MIPDTSHLSRQLELAFCPNKEWENRGALGGGGQTRVWGGGCWVKGRFKWRESAAETRAEEDDGSFNINQEEEEVEGGAQQPLPVGSKRIRLGNKRSPRPTDMLIPFVCLNSISDSFDFFVVFQVEIDLYV